MLPLAFGIRFAETPTTNAAENVRIGTALRNAFCERDFWSLSLGFFVCGFQVVFIAIHLPTFLADEGIGRGVATTALALIGLVNIAGTYYASVWGRRRSKPHFLIWIDFARAAAIAAFVLLTVSAHCVEIDVPKL